LVDQGGFTVVNVGDDGDVSNMVHCGSLGGCAELGFLGGERLRIPPFLSSELEVLGGAPMWVLKKLGAQYAVTLRDTQGSRVLSARL
jgi:hypothetical protein